jgi:hypothetical protein
MSTEVKSHLPNEVFSKVISNRMTSLYNDSNVNCPIIIYNNGKVKYFSNFFRISLLLGFGMEKLEFLI